MREFSGSQLLAWYRAQQRAIGGDKLIDLQLVTVPHAEDPNGALRDIKQALTQLREPDDG